ncbi:hypothetical protein BLNAU_11338 [Blattamonas nauphoetae]|uniref:Uncharacterized protein n=1 Tax=Blattamonas nauphoetae TaxID=2049346 RepID=A0ABQ9XN01_9EUKA|nr:hypothetical protein BLNAU_11338 [Blattamonas nauphoetae]
MSHAHKPSSGSPTKSGALAIEQLINQSRQTILYAEPSVVISYLDRVRILLPKYSNASKALLASDVPELLQSRKSTSDDITLSDSITKFLMALYTNAAKSSEKLSSGHSQHETNKLAIVKEENQKAQIEFDEEEDELLSEALGQNKPLNHSEETEKHQNLQPKQRKSQENPQSISKAPSEDGTVNEHGKEREEPQPRYRTQSEERDSIDVIRKVNSTLQNQDNATTDDCEEITMKEDQESTRTDPSKEVSSIPQITTRSTASHHSRTPSLPSPPPERIGSASQRSRSSQRKPSPKPDEAPPPKQQRSSSMSRRKEMAQTAPVIRKTTARNPPTSPTSSKHSQAKGDFDAFLKRTEAKEEQRLKKIAERKKEQEERARSEADKFSFQPKINRRLPVRPVQPAMGSTAPVHMSTPNRAPNPSQYSSFLGSSPNSASRQPSILVEEDIEFEGAPVEDRLWEWEKRRKENLTVLRALRDPLLDEEYRFRPQINQPSPSSTSQHAAPEETQRLSEKVNGAEKIEERGRQKRAELEKKEDEEKRKRVEYGGSFVKANMTSRDKRRSPTRTATTPQSTRDATNTASRRWEQEPSSIQPFGTDMQSLMVLPPSIFPPQGVKWVRDTPSPQHPPPSPPADSTLSATRANLTFRFESTDSSLASEQDPPTEQARQDKKASFRAFLERQMKTHEAKYEYAQKFEEDVRREMRDNQFKPLPMSERLCSRSEDVQNTSTLSSTRNETGRAKKKPEEFPFKPTINAKSQQKTNRGVEQLSMGDMKRRQETIQRISDEVNEAELREATFEPALTSEGKKSRGRLWMSEMPDYQQRLKRESELVELRMTERRMQEEEEEMRECTFTPKLTTQPDITHRIAVSLRGSM